MTYTLMAIAVPLDGYGCQLKSQMLPLEMELSVCRQAIGYGNVDPVGFQNSLALFECQGQVFEGM